MPNAATHSYTNLKLEPAIAPETAIMHGLPMTSGTYARGQVLGLVTATKRYAPYDDSASDGRNVAKAVAAYAATVDSSNNVSVNGEQGITQRTLGAYLDGYFRVEDLVGLDANGIADLGRLVTGNTTSGILKLY